MSKPASIPVVAVCRWFERNPLTLKWESDDGDEGPVRCRGSLGARKLTVWLPKGARIQCRVAGDPMAQTFISRYGRMRWNKIEITLEPMQEASGSVCTNPFNVPDDDYWRNGQHPDRKPRR